MKCVLKLEICERIYLAFSRALLEYSCEVRNNCSQMDNDRLEKIHLEAACIVIAVNWAFE